MKRKTRPWEEWPSTKALHVEDPLQGLRKVRKTGSPGRNHAQLWKPLHSEGPFCMWNPGFDIGKVASQLESLVSLICRLWIYQVSMDLPTRFSQVRIGIIIMNLFKVFFKKNYANISSIDLIINKCVQLRNFNMLNVISYYTCQLKNDESIGYLQKHCVCIHQE